MAETTDGALEESATILGKRTYDYMSQDDQSSSIPLTEGVENIDLLRKKKGNFGVDNEVNDDTSMVDYATDKPENDMDLDGFKYRHLPTADYSEQSSEASSGSDIDSDDESEVDDIGDTATKHCEQLEPFPSFPIYDDCMLTLKDRMVQIPAGVQDLIKGLDPTSDFVKRQLQRCNELLSLPIPKITRIALLGDAGKGKSSLINSLTDIDSLARSLSGGSSCTCVPTEYQGPFKTQIEPFAAQIIYYSNEQIRGMFEELISDYNIFNFEADLDWDVNEEELYQKRAQNAFDIFIGLFQCDILAGPKDVALKVFECSYVEDKSRKLLECMLKASQIMLKGKVKADDGTRFETVEAATVTKLQIRLDPLINSTSRVTIAAVWPLVRQVKIGVRGPRILEHVALVDLPGISDTNQLRAKNCHDYIKTCDILWAISSITRVVDDSTIHQLMSRYGKPFKGNVAIIATFIDDGADSKLAAWLEKEEVDLHLYRELTEQLKEKKKALTVLKREARRLRSRYNKRDDNVAGRYMTLTAVNIPQTEKEIDETACHRLETLVNARNTKVNLGLHGKFDGYLPEGMHATVFCVSNLHYAAARGQKRVKAPKLSIYATGIPAIRKHVLSLVAKGLLENVENYLYNTLNLLLKDLSLWIEEPVAPYRDELLRNVKALTMRYEIKVDMRRNYFDSIVDRNIAKPFKKDIRHYHQHAIKILDLKRKQRHFQTIIAFIRHFGNWGTRACPKESWNEQFARLPIEMITAAWPHLQEKRVECTQNFLNLLCNDLKEVTSSLDPNLVQRFSVDRFQDIIDAYIIDFGSLFAASEADYEKSFRNILLDVTVDSEQNHFSSKMRSIYEDCQRESGTGMFKRSMKKIERPLSQPRSDSPFMQMEKSLIHAIKANDRYQLTESLGKQLRKAFTSLHISFSAMARRETCIAPTKKASVLKGIEKMEEERKSIVQSLVSLKSSYVAIKQEDGA